LLLIIAALVAVIGLAALLRGAGHGSGIPGGCGGLQRLDLE
jgi:hypothetical protein